MTPDSATAPRARAQLRLFDVVCIGLAGIIGSGIFVLPPQLARLLGPLSPLAFLIAALSTVPIALCFAEMASRTSRSGGPYGYAREAFGQGVGFGVGWLVFASVNVSWPTIALAIPLQLREFIPGIAAPEVTKAIAVGLILFTGAINYLGLRWGADAVDLLTVLKALPLAALALIGLTHLGKAHWIPEHLPPITSFGRAWFLAMFAMSGFELVPLPAGETADPRRNIPRALIGAVAGASLLYLLLQAVAVATVPGLAQSPRPLSEAGTIVLGPFGAKAIAAAGLLSMLGFLSSGAFLAPRALGVMAEGRDLPRALAWLHPRFGTPGKAIIATTTIGATLAAVVPFQNLLEMSVLTTLPQYLSTCLGLAVVRRRPSAEPPLFRVPFGDVTIAAALAVTIALATQAQTTELLVTGSFLALGYGLRAIALARRRGEATDGEG